MNADCTGLNNILILAIGIICALLMGFMLIIYQRDTSKWTSRNEYVVRMYLDLHRRSGQATLMAHHAEIRKGLYRHD